MLPLIAMQQGFFSSLGDPIQVVALSKAQKCPNFSPAFYKKKHFFTMAKRKFCKES
jgi:hypothetical protein